MTRPPFGDEHGVMGSHARESHHEPERPSAPRAAATSPQVMGAGLVTSLQRTAGNAAVTRALRTRIVAQRVPPGAPPAQPPVPVLGRASGATGPTTTLYHYGDLTGVQHFESKATYPRLTEYGPATSQREVADATGTGIRPSLKYRYELVVDNVYLEREFVKVGPRSGSYYYEFGTRLKIPISYFRNTGTLTAKPSGGGGPTGGLGGRTPPVTGGGGGGVKAGTRVTAAAVLVVAGLNIGFNWYIGRQNERDIKQALATVEPELLRLQRTRPDQGILLDLRFTGGVDSGEGPTAAARFAGLSYSVGRSEDEAMAARKASMEQAGSTHSTFWIKPLSPVAVPPVGWTPVAVATFADLSQVEFQRLRFAQIGGFSTGGSIGPVDLSGRPVMKQLEFLVLRVPPQIPYSGPGGGEKREEVTVSDRPVTGGAVPALMADGDPVIAVVAANDLTVGLFEAGGSALLVDDKVKALRVPHLSAVRWLAPDQLKVLRKL
jgi:hypothetical protein